MENNKYWVFKRAPSTILGIIVIGLLVSVLYDLLIRPGLSTSGRILLDIATLGSQTVKDTAYASAALDPTSVTPLILVTAGLSFVTFIVILPIIRPLRKWVRSKLSNDVSEGEKSFRWKIFLFYIFFVLWLSPLIIGFSVHNQSILIWRVFHSDLMIITPYIEAKRKNIILANFSSMSSKSDYDAIQEELREIAKTNNVSLHDVDLW